MNKNRTELLKTIKALQRLMPSDDYSQYFKQAQHKYLKYIPPHQFLPAMDEKSPKSLNDVELNVLSKSRFNYLKNIFIPTVADKQPHILKETRRDTESEAIERWSKKISNVQSPDELIKLINRVNLLKKSTGYGHKKTSFWKSLFG
jgi:hypothetical protein